MIATGANTPLPTCCDKSAIAKDVITKGCNTLLPTQFCRKSAIAEGFTKGIVTPLPDGAVPWRQRASFAKPTAGCLCENHVVAPEAAAAADFSAPV